jgi:hypothetical protein
MVTNQRQIHPVLGETPLEEWIGRYEQRHQNPVNRIFHKFGIPMIVVSLLLFLLSFSLAWQVLQEIRQVLEILGAQRMPYEGEMKRFRVEGDFLIRALLISIAINRTQIQRLENAFSELGELASRYGCPVNS